MDTDWRGGAGGGAFNIQYSTRNNQFPRRRDQEAGDRRQGTEDGSMIPILEQPERLATKNAENTKMGREGKGAREGFNIQSSFAKATADKYSTRNHQFPSPRLGRRPP